jgi:hypothetical protein
MPPTPFLIILLEYLRVTMNNTFPNARKKDVQRLLTAPSQNNAKSTSDWDLKTLAKFLVSYFLLPRRTLCFSRFSTSVSPSQCVRVKNRTILDAHLLSFKFLPQGHSSL